MKVPSPPLNISLFEFELPEVVTVSRTGESLILGSRKEPENGEEEIVESWKSGPSS
ncbi:MAG: hypothetical protein ACI93T_000921, partial [Porticoccaceae bacterium]